MLYELRHLSGMLMSNLVQMLQSRAAQNPDDPAYLFLIDGEQEGPLPASWQGREPRL